MKASSIRSTGAPCASRIAISTRVGDDRACGPVPKQVRAFSVIECVPGGQAQLIPRLRFQYFGHRVRRTCSASHSRRSISDISEAILSTGIGAGAGPRLIEASVAAASAGHLGDMFRLGIGRWWWCFAHYALLSCHMGAVEKPRWNVLRPHQQFRQRPHQRVKSVGAIARTRSIEIRSEAAKLIFKLRERADVMNFSLLVKCADRFGSGDLAAAGVNCLKLTPRETIRNVSSTMSPPLFTSAMTRSALCR